MKKGQLLYLSQQDVADLQIQMEEIILLVEKAFHEKGNGKIEMPPKPGIHPGGGDNFIHAMPAYIPAMRSAGVKWVSGFPENNKKGLPYITGLLIFNDVDTGVPLAVMDCVWITAVRTGAATAVAAKHLARSDASVAGVLGCGTQGYTNVQALREVLLIEMVKAYDIDPERANVYREKIEADFDLPTTIVDTPREAVSGCDLVVTAGPIQKQPHQTIQAGWMDSGAFASLVDFDSYWHPGALHEMDKFCTDDIDQLLHYQEVGYFQDIPDVYADLGELVVGKNPGRENDNERNCTANLGLAIDDMAVAPLVYQRAIDLGIGQWLEL